MIKKSEISSGGVFVKHFFLGITSIALSIFFISTNPIFGKDISLPLIKAGFIFFINLIIVGSFTQKIISNPQLLSEEDSPDHAYYLGFCLTLASLALIFFADAIANQNIKDVALKADLVRGALTQFAAGLLATLLGLSARIYISSLQNLKQAEPTQLLEDLKQNVRDFTSDLAESRNFHTEAITNSVKKLTQTLAKMEQSAESLSVTFEQTSVNLEQSLASSSISFQAAQFLDSLKELNSETKTQSLSFTDNLKDLSGNTSAMTDDMANTTSKLREINNTITIFTSKMLDLSNNDFPRVSVSAQTLITDLDSASTSIGKGVNYATDQIQLLTKALNDSKLAADQMSANFQSIEISRLKTDIAVLSQSVEKLSADILNLSQQIQDSKNSNSRFFN